jgi:FkbM family methyltransferase
VADAEASISIENRAEYTRVKSMFEDDVLKTLLDDIEPDDVFYDIGANIGVYSCLVDNILSAGSVVAIEPHPSNAERLQKNVSSNNLETTVIQEALSNEEGEVELAVAVESHTTSPGHNLIELNESVKEYSEASAQTVTVDMLKGDHLISKENLLSPTVIKLDVEGAELDVLRGLEKTLSRNDCRLIYCEVHRDHLQTFGGTESEVHDILTEHGFSIERLNDHGAKYHLCARK